MGTPTVSPVTTRNKKPAKAVARASSSSTRTGAAASEPQRLQSALPPVPSSIPAHPPAGGPSLPPPHRLMGRRLLLLQRKLAIGSTSDPLEAEADAVADRVMRMGESANGFSQPAAEPVLRRKCACEGAGNSCESCEAEKKKLTCKATGAVAPVEAPPIVHDVLRSPGRPLDASARNFLESRFGYDFSRVRIHTEESAEASARAINARAYSMNSHLVFAKDEYRPSSDSGMHLIAHELAHVVQQSDSPPIRRMRRAEDEESPVAVSAHASRNVIRRVPASCADLVDPAVTEAVRIDEKDVQGPLAVQIPGSVRELPIPTGSYTAYREKRQGVGGPKEGTGRIDIALTRKPNLEILEVKRADFDGLATGIEQLANYVEKGNRSEVADCAAGLGVSTVVPMPTSRFTGKHVRATGSEEPVTLRWCSPGLIVFKAVREQDRDLFVCTTRDQGKIDAFLRPKLFRTFDVVDEFIDNNVGPKIEAAINSIPLGDILKRLVQSPEGKALVEKLLPGSSVLLDKIDVKTLGDLAEKALGQFAPAIRAIAMDFKRKLIDAVRQRLRDQLLNTLQQELNVLCATVTVLTFNELLQRLRDNMPKLFGEAVAEVARRLPQRWPWIYLPKRPKQC